MSRMMLLCEKITANRILRDFFENTGFNFLHLDNIVCSKCEFKTRATLTISHIQFMHRLFNPQCEMVRYICDKYENYGLCKLLLHINSRNNIQNCVSETEIMLRESFRSWPKRLPCVEKLVSAGFFYNGVGDYVTCVECKVILHDWEATDDPWIEHAKASPDCLLVKMHSNNI